MTKDDIKYTFNIAEYIKCTHVYNLRSTSEK